MIHLYSPNQCPVCKKENSDGRFCVKCAPIPLDSRRRCSRCYSALEQGGCKFCRERILLFDRHISTFGLNSECKRVLQDWKFENQRQAYKWFLPYIESRLNALLEQEDIMQLPGYLTYIDSGTSARNIRNYQPVKDLGLHLQKPHLPLERMISKTGGQKQSAYGRADRFFQVKDSIQLTVKYRPAFYYVLLEDVFTTGATAMEATRILKRRCRAPVYVLSLFMAD